MSAPLNLEARGRERTGICISVTAVLAQALTERRLR